MSGTSSPAPVTVIGLGPMGQAMAAVWLRAGHPVTVWNRTPKRADALVAAGATLAATPAEAVAASELTVLSLTDYQGMYDILGPALEDPRHRGFLAGKTLVNLSSDTPQRSREAAAWAAEQQAQFVTGGIMVPAPMVGEQGAYVFYSGPSDAFAGQEATLGLVGEPRYVGDDPGLAQLFYQAHLAVFLTSLSSLLHATALITAAGVPAAKFLPDALTTFTDIPAMLGDPEELALQLENGKHPGDLSTATMMGATAAHILETSERSGVESTLPAAVKSHYDRAIAAGRGSEDWTVLYEMIKANR